MDLSVATAPDPLDVTLHDAELATEVELTSLLMVAANETEDMLEQRAIDEILGLC